MADEPLTILDAVVYLGTDGRWWLRPQGASYRSGLGFGLRAAVRNAWVYDEPGADEPALTDVEVSVEPFEGTESSGFVARATVRGTKLSEVDKDRGEAMTKLVEAARVRGQMERAR